MAEATGRTGAFMTTTTTKTGEHVGLRPTWECLVCARPWPCAGAKEAMRAEFQGFPSVMTIYMSAQMVDAAEDLMAQGAEPPPDLYERFLAWIRPAVPEPPAHGNRGEASRRAAGPPPIPCAP
jgi:hypothetical protein